MTNGKTALKNKKKSESEPHCVPDGVKNCNNNESLTKSDLITKPDKKATVELLVGGPYKKHGKNQPYGHVALRVITSTKDITYDYGRYGKVWGIGGSEGEGMLRVWTDFNRYIRGENVTGRVTTGHSFIVDEDDAKKIIKYFEYKIKDKKPNQDRGFMKQYRIDDYHALKTNCTTVSIDGAKKALPSLMQGSKKYNKGGGLSVMDKLAAKYEGWPQKVFMPADLNNFLNSLKGETAPTQAVTYKK